MKVKNNLRFLFGLAFASLCLVWLSSPAITQTYPPLDVREADGSPVVSGTRRIVVPNGSLAKSGTIATLSFNSVLLGTDQTKTAGTGAGTAVLSGVMTVNSTQAATGANTNETDLWTYSLPANVLSANNKAVRITVSGDTAANANLKTMKVYFGATVVMTSTAVAFNNTPWRFVVDVVRTGASAQVAFGQVLIHNSSGQRVNSTTPAADTTQAITIKLTGQNGTASAGDITFKQAIVEILN